MAAPVRGKPRGLIRSTDDSRMTIDKRSFRATKCLAAVLFLLAALAACRGNKEKDKPGEVADAAPANLAPVPSQATSTTSAEPAPGAETESETVQDLADAGDAGRRKRRLLKKDAGPEAHLPESAPTAPPPATAESPADKPQASKPPMHNDQPYGASAASGAGVLKKAPLPKDDPWK